MVFIREELCKRSHKWREKEPLCQAEEKPDIFRKETLYSHVF